jgi:hypothetical protein
MRPILSARIRGAGLRVSCLRGHAPATRPTNSRKRTRELADTNIDFGFFLCRKAQQTALPRVAGNRLSRYRRSTPHLRRKNPSAFRVYLLHSRAFGRNEVVLACLCCARRHSGTGTCVLRKRTCRPVASAQELGASAALASQRCSSLAFYSGARHSRPADKSREHIKSATEFMWRLRDLCPRSWRWVSHDSSISGLLGIATESQATVIPNETNAPEMVLQATGQYSICHWREVAPFTSYVLVSTSRALTKSVGYKAGGRL